MQANTFAQLQARAFQLLVSAAAMVQVNTQARFQKRKRSRSRSPRSGSPSPKPHWLRIMQQGIHAQLCRINMGSETEAPDQQAAGEHAGDGNSSQAARGGSSASFSASSGDGYTYSAGSYSGGSSGDGYTYRAVTIASSGDGSCWIQAKTNPNWWVRYVPRKYAYQWVRHPQQPGREIIEPEYQSDQKDQSMTTEAHEPEDQRSHAEQ